MARYQNQSSGTVIAGREARFAPGEIKEGDYQRLADAGILVRLPDAPAPKPVPKPAPRAPAPAPAPERKERVAPEAVEDLAAHGQTLKDLEKEEPEPKSKSVAKRLEDQLENAAAKTAVDVKDDSPKPERKSSPKASRKRRAPRKR